MHFLNRAISWLCELETVSGISTRLKARKVSNIAMITQKCMFQGFINPQAWCSISTGPVWRESYKPQFQIQFETSVSVSVHSLAANLLCTRFCRPFSMITIACFTMPYTVRQLIHCVLQMKISIFSLFSVLLWIKTFEIYLFLVDCYFHVYFPYVEATIIISSHFRKINKSPCVWGTCLPWPSNQTRNTQWINHCTVYENWNWNWDFKVTQFD